MALTPKRLDSARVMLTQPILIYTSRHCSASLWNKPAAAAPVAHRLLDLMKTESHVSIMEEGVGASECNGRHCGADWVEKKCMPSASSPCLHALVASRAKGRVIASRGWEGVWAEGVF